MVIDGDADNCYVAFVPERSCYYTFSSYGDLDTFCELFDSNYYILASGDDADDQNFSLYTFLDAGKSYILNVRIYDSGVGTFEIDVENTHGYQAVDTPPTCVAEGYTTYTCTVCGATDTEEMELAEHQYGTIVTPPSCTIPGYTTHTCFICGADYTENVISPLGHTEVIPKKEP